MDIQKYLELSKITLSTPESEMMQSSINGIMELANKIHIIEPTNVPMYSPTQYYPSLLSLESPDAIGNTLNSNEVMNNNDNSYFFKPLDLENNSFVSPQILEK